MRALLGKELRALFPLYLLLAFMLSGDIVERAFTARFDDLSWTDVSSDLGGGAQGAEGFAVILIPLALAVAYSAFPREHDERTIEFLHALPVSRLAIFFAKVLAGATVLSVAVAGGAFTEWLQQVGNPQSYLGEQWRLDVAATVVLLRTSFALVIYAHGLLTSVFRRFGLIPFVLVSFVVLELEELDPGLAFVDPSNLLAYEFEGRTIVLPYRELGLHLGAAFVSLVLAGLAWLGPAERVTQALASLEVARFGRFALGCGTFLVFVLASSFVVYVFDEGEDADAGEEAVQIPVSFAVVEASTAHYRVRYPANLRGRALPLLGEADALYERTRSVLGVEALPEIHVDLTHQSEEHLGIAAWTSVRVGLADHEDRAELRHTFAHETAHVFQGHASDLRQESAGGFFTEGSAEYVAFEVVPRPDARAASRRLAALAYERHGLGFDDLVDGARLRLASDHALEYPVGETFASALEATCGPGAIGRVLRVWSEADAPRNLRGRALYQETLQRIDCDLEGVLGRWATELDRIAESERAALESVPRLGAGVTESTDDEVVVTIGLDRDPPVGSSVWLRARENAAVSDTEVFGFPAERGLNDRTFTAVIPRDLLQGERIEVQAGIECPALSRPFFELWQSVETSAR